MLRFSNCIYIFGIIIAYVKVSHSYSPSFDYVKGALHWVPSFYGLLMNDIDKLKYMLIAGCFIYGFSIGMYISATSRIFV